MTKDIIEDFEKIKLQVMKKATQQANKEQLAFVCGIAIDKALKKQKEDIIKEIDKALKVVKGGGNGRRLLEQLKANLK